MGGRPLGRGPSSRDPDEVGNVCSEDPTEKIEAEWPGELEELEWRSSNGGIRAARPEPQWPAGWELPSTDAGGSSVEWWPGQGRVGSVTHARVCGDGRGPSSDPSTQHASQLLVCREDRKWPSGT